MELDLQEWQLSQEQRPYQQDAVLGASTSVWSLSPAPSAHEAPL
jgi:hypothetical protein